MKPDWLKSATEETWTAKAHGCRLAVLQTQFGSYSYMVTGGERRIRTGNSDELEVAQMRAEQLAGELS